VNEVVSIVVLTYNGKDLLEENLPSIMRAIFRRGAGDELIVVDNGSSDGTELFLRKEFPAAKVLRLDTNQSVGAAYNAGVFACSQRIVILLNNDVQVTSDFIQPLVKHFQCQDVFSVSSLSLSPGKRKKAEELPYYIAYGGGQTAYDRDKFLMLGGFHPIYGKYYYEDRDLGYRAWKRGWKSLCEPLSVVYHEGEKTIKRDSRRQVQLLKFRNRIIFFLSCYDSFWEAFLPLVWSVVHVVLCFRPYLLLALFWVYRNRAKILKKRNSDRPFWKYSDREVRKMLGKRLTAKKNEGNQLSDL